MLTVQAGELALALQPALALAKKKRANPVVVTLKRCRHTRELLVTEARHALFAGSLPAKGIWRDQVQLDAAPLFRYAASFPADVVLELSADPKMLSVRSGTSSARFPRTDEGGAAAIQQAPLPPNKKHKGKPVVRWQDQFNSIVPTDTWGFTARVPLPRRRDPDSE